MYSRPIAGFIISILVLLCCVPVCAQVSKQPTFLWAVFTKGDTVPSFLYGTIHHLGPRPILDSRLMMGIILKSNYIVMEADTTELYHRKSKRYDYTVDTPLDQLIGFADYQLVQQEFLAATGRKLDDYKYKMPQIIMSMIDDGRTDQDPDHESGPLMENALYAMSRVKGKSIEGLETRDDMYEIMYRGMPLQEQARLLLYYLKEMRFSSTKELMLECFQKQDLNCFCEIDDMNHYTRPGDTAIIVNRNLFWMPKIEHHLKQRNVFIAVGAAHLCGRFGIVALLRKRGYVLIPVRE